MKQRNLVIPGQAIENSSKCQPSWIKSFALKGEILNKVISA